MSRFERTTKYKPTESITNPGSAYIEPCSYGTTITEINDLTGEYAEEAKMRESVKENKGFYIARYEAGKEGTSIVVIKKGATVWNNIPWRISMTEIGTEGAVYRARQMYKGSKSVVSTLCLWQEMYVNGQWKPALLTVVSVVVVVATVVALSSQILIVVPSIQEVAMTFTVFALHFTSSSTGI